MAVARISATSIKPSLQGCRFRCRHSASRKTSPTSSTPLAPKPNASNPSTRSEEHTSELQSLMRISYAVFCLKKKNTLMNSHPTTTHDTPIVNIQLRTHTPHQQYS